MISGGRGGVAKWDIFKINESTMTSLPELLTTYTTIYIYIYIFGSQLKLQVQLKRMDIHHFITWPSTITVSPLFLYLFPPLSWLFFFDVTVFFFYVYGFIL